MPSKKRRVSRLDIVQPSDPATKYIALTKGQVAVVDAENYEWLNQWNWRAAWSPLTKTFYAVRTDRSDGKKTVFMHREVLHYSGDLHTDHIFGLTLDNRKSQLRLATNAQNQSNKGLQSNSTSGLKGVSWHKRIGMWQARITISKVTLHLGYFSTPEEAHLAYVNKALEIYGEFARAA